MGRHARAPEGAATRKITVRLPEPVAAQWAAAAAAAGLTISDWMRLRAADTGAATPAGWVGRRPPAKRRGIGAAPAPTVDPALVAQLARIGNNLNQIARRLNSGDRLDLAGLAVLNSIARDINRALARPERGR